MGVPGTGRRVVPVPPGGISESSRGRDRVRCRCVSEALVAALWRRGGGHRGGCHREGVLRGGREETRVLRVFWTGYRPKVHLVGTPQKCPPYGWHRGVSYIVDQIFNIKQFIPKTRPGTWYCLCVSLFFFTLSLFWFFFCPLALLKVSSHSFFSCHCWIMLASKVFHLVFSFDFAKVFSDISGCDLAIYTWKLIYWFSSSAWHQSSLYFKRTV